VEEDNLYYKSIDGVLYDYNVTTILYYPANSSTTIFEIPSSVSIIGGFLFYYSVNLVSVIIPDHITVIEEYAFYNCTSLTDVILPSSLVTIGSHAFFNCDSLTGVIIPESVENIGSLAFDGSSSLTLYVKYDSKLDGWDYDWFSHNTKIVWGYTE
jgi:hypothetical protein